MRRLLYILPLVLLFSSCEHEGGKDPGGNEDYTGGKTDVVQMTSVLSVDITSDKAFYKPGETVSFEASEMPSGAKIRYRVSGETVYEQDASGTGWTWTPPATDFTGYMVEVYIPKEDGSEEIRGTFAVDVSSDPAFFPRYGFVATFDGSKLQEGVIEEEMAFLNRCHINWVQFQDWHNKHHWPLGGTRDRLEDVYKDIANRDTYTEVIKRYISTQHGYGMKSIFYNLCYGVLDDAASDGVKEEWYIFKGQGHTDKDSHNLPSSWKSNIYIVDPSNTEWQDYIGQRNDDVYANLDFDGYQIDQLGDRGDRYDYNGNKINMPKGYASFIGAMKAKHPDKALIMNAVSSYGASQIAGTGNVEFLYNEVWGDQQNFSDLRTIVMANDQYSGGGMKTVFAAYMNYNVADNKGTFNTPGILMADAVMFAVGGAHLELGDHMLCKEYFPNSNLEMGEDLKTAMVRYYDFMTAYQNILRGTSTDDEFDAEITCTDSGKNLKISAWPPELKKIITYSRNTDDAMIVHFLNFKNADNLSWRDLDGTMPEPECITDIPLSMNVSRKAVQVFAATPDNHGGAMQELAFEQKDGAVSFTLPSLKYWTMVIIKTE